MGVADASITWPEGAPVKCDCPDLAKTHASFDDPNLVSRTGLVPVMALARRAGLAALASGQVAIAGRCGVNRQLKVACLVAGMIAGADSNEDTCRGRNRRPTARHARACLVRYRPAHLLQRQGAAASAHLCLAASRCR
jgi:hypothetical protein